SAQVRACPPPTPTRSRGSRRSCCTRRSAPFRPDQVVERAQRLLDGHAPVLHVHLVEVDVVGPQPSQRLLAVPEDALARKALLVGMHRRGPAQGGKAALGGERDLLAPALHPLAEQLLAAAFGIAVGGV